MNEYTVYKFKMFFGDSFEDMQERYVVAKTEDEAIAKFHKYLEELVADGFQAPSSYWDCPTVEIDYCIC